MNNSSDYFLQLLQSTNNNNNNNNYNNYNNTIPIQKSTKKLSHKKNSTISKIAKHAQLIIKDQYQQSKSQLQLQNSYYPSSFQSSLSSSSSSSSSLPLTSKPISNYNSQNRHIIYDPRPPTSEQIRNLYGASQGKASRILDSEIENGSTIIQIIDRTYSNSASKNSINARYGYSKDREIFGSLDMTGENTLWTIRIISNNNNNNNYYKTLNIQQMAETGYFSAADKNWDHWLTVQEWEAHLAFWSLYPIRRLAGRNSDYSKNFFDPSDVEKRPLYTDFGYNYERLHPLIHVQNEPQVCMLDTAIQIQNDIHYKGIISRAAQRWTVLNSIWLRPTLPINDLRSQLYLKLGIVKIDPNNSAQVLNPWIKDIESISDISTSPELKHINDPQFPQYYISDPKLRFAKKAFFTYIRIACSISAVPSFCKECEEIDKRPWHRGSKSAHGKLVHKDPKVCKLCNGFYSGYTNIDLTNHRKFFCSAPNNNST